MRGHVRKRGKKYSIVVYLGTDDLTGKTKYKWFSGYDSKRTAEDDLPNKLKEVSIGLHQYALHETIESYFTQWLKIKSKEVQESTLESYENRMKRQVIPTLGSVRLEKLTPRHLRELYNRMQSGDKPLSNRTVEYTHVIINMMLEQAVADKVIPHNPAKSVKPPRPQRKEMLIWSFEDIAIFWQVARNGEPRYCTAFYLAAMTGMRKSEVLGLRWSDIDFDGQSLTVRQRLAVIRGELKFGPPKSKSSRRTIAISEEDVAELKRHRSEQTKERLVFDGVWQDNDLVIARFDGRPVSPSTLSDAWERILSATDLPRLTPHGLRHTHVSLLLAAGENLKAISERVGHYSAAFTLDTYAHSLPAAHRQLATTFSDQLRDKNR